jgi:general stress protein 26
MATTLSSFRDIEPDFSARVREIVWCTVATTDGKGRPRSRVLHPLWEGSTGWILTSRHSRKEKHLAGNPYVSLSYANQELEQVYADCRAEWEDRSPEKSRIWDLFASTPPPVGYDPIAFWPGGKQDPTFGVLRLTPWRIEVVSLASLMQGGGKIWRA